MLDNKSKQNLHIELTSTNHRNNFLYGKYDKVYGAKSQNRTFWNTRDNK